MNAADKHYKFINSRTGNVIFYYSLSADLKHEQVKAELEKVRVEVAVKNNLFLGTVYWEEIKDEE